MRSSMKPNYKFGLFSLQIVGAGTILLGNTLRMSSQQKTFSVALSRQMSPFARIIVYFMQGGEVVTDSLNFYVRDTRLFKVMKYYIVYIIE